MTVYATETSIDMISKVVELQSGNLILSITATDLPLEELCGFASRANPKRGYLFVSKVLGKHYPVRPSVMDNIHARLARKLTVPQQPAVVIGLAETATGLAQGVYEKLLQRGCDVDILYQHTTRYALNRPLAFEFSEPHSHAPKHLLYHQESSGHQRTFAQANELILVDDEMSTGTTLANLVRSYRLYNPKLSRVQVVSLTNWLSPENEAAFRKTAGVPTEFHSLLRGTFDFEPDPRFQPPPIPESKPMDIQYLDPILPHNFGRLGRQGMLDFSFEQFPLFQDIAAAGRVLVLGTGEFAYPPFLLARWLELRGVNVHFQTTTRSPILVGGAITHVATSLDNYHEGIANFVYNVAPESYDRIVIGYETAKLPGAHDFAHQLGADVVVFEKQKLRMC